MVLSPTRSSPRYTWFVVLVHGGVNGMNVSFETTDMMNRVRSRQMELDGTCFIGISRPYLCGTVSLLPAIPL